jgi:hypothetical protein
MQGGQQLDESAFGSLVQPEIGQKLGGFGEKQAQNLRMVEPGEIGFVGFHQTPAAAISSLGDHRYSGGT